MKLISTTEFIIKLQKSDEYKSYFEESDDWFNRSVDYAEFLKQLLKIEMFVPCDDDGNVLEVPYYADGIDKVNQYKQAKEKVLFEGFRFQNEGYVTNGIFKFDKEYLENKTIEDLIKYDLTLTQTAINKLGL